MSFLDRQEGRVHQQDVQIARRDTPQDNYLQAVLQLIQRAGKEGSAGHLFDSYLRVEAHVLESVRNEELMKLVRDESLAAAEKWDSDGDLVVHASNWELTEPSPHVAPYSVFPYPSAIRAGLLMNTIWLETFLNLSEVLRRFERQGWQIESSTLDTVEEALNADRDTRSAPFARISKENLTIELPSSYGARLLHEFVKPHVFVREVNEEFQRGPNESLGPSLAYYPGERRIWQ